MAAFIETPRFPETISFWGRGGPGYKTTIVKTYGGSEKRIPNWDESLCRFDLSNAMKTIASREVFTAFFRAMKGMAYGFRYKDWGDYQTSLTTGYINATGLGDSTATGLLYKYYAAGANTELRRIKKPCASPAPAIYKNGLLQVVTTNYTINTATGTITWVGGNPTISDVLRWVGEFDVPVRFDTDDLEGAMDRGGLFVWENLSVVELRNPS